MTPITRNHLSRRTVLRGIGATIALPWLDAMRPALAAAEPSRPLRLAFVYVPNGVIPEAWTPLGVGKDYELSPYLEVIKEEQRADYDHFRKLARTLFPSRR